MMENLKKAPEPIVKWVGGKRNLLPEIDKRLPKTINNYYEPFFGGGAVFFHLIQQCEIMGDYYLTDDNASLMETYVSIMYDCEDVIDILEYMRYRVAQCNKDSFKEYYYDIRRRFNDRNINFEEVFASPPSYEMAAMFLFLNHTCFNGLYRVNSKGEFNVPVGDKIKFPFDENYYDKLRSVGAFLKAGKLVACMDFRNALYSAYIPPKKGDFVFLDPLYRNSYNNYTSHGFSDDDQRDLARAYRILDEKGVNLMLCNSYSDDGFFEDLYDGFCIEEVSARRCINPCSDVRAKEVIITNYSYE